MQVADVLDAIPQPIRDLKQGVVLYSGRTAWCRADRPEIYLLGYNPGGAPGQDTHTLHQQASEALDRKRWSAYLDESWRPNAAPGDSPMQRRVRGLSDLLGIDLATTPASNVVFSRSAQIDHLAPQLRRDWEDHCWSFHRTMIDALRPRVVVCMGNDAYRAVSSRRPGVPVVKIRHTSRSSRTWAEEQAPIVRAALDQATG